MTVAAAGAALIAGGCLMGRAYTVAYTFDVKAWAVQDATPRPLPVVAGRNGAVIEDAGLRIRSSVQAGRIVLEIRNSGRGPVRVRLADARYETPAGDRLALAALSDDPANAMPSSRTVEPLERVRIRLWPRPWLHTPKGLEAGAWRADCPLCGATVAAREPDVALKHARTHLNAWVEIRLPVEGVSGPRVYRLRFRVIGASSEPTLWA